MDHADLRAEINALLDAADAKQLKAVRDLLAPQSTLRPLSEREQDLLR